MDMQQFREMIDDYKTAIVTDLRETKAQLAKFEAAGFSDPGTLEKLRRDIDGLATRMNRTNVNGYLPGMEATLGDLFTSDNEFRQWHHSQGWKSRRDVRVEFKSPSAGGPLISPSGPRSATANITLPPGAPFMVAPIVRGVATPEGPLLGLRQMMSSIPVASDSVRVPVDASAFTDFTADYQGNYGDKKKASTLKLNSQILPIITVAHYVKVPTQMMDDLPFLSAWINSKLLLGLQIKVEKELLSGLADSVSPAQLSGLLHLPPATYAGAATTIIDAALDCKQLIYANGFTPTAYVFSPAAWASVEGSKNTYGDYLLGRPGAPATVAGQQLWGLPVIVTAEAATLFDFVCGDFAQANIFDRMAPSIAIATQNEDDFVRNLITIRAEERLQSAWYFANAFIKKTASVLLETEGKKGR